MAASDRDWRFGLVDSLEKVFPEEAPPTMPDVTMTAFIGERVSFQVAFRPPDDVEKAGNAVEVVVTTSDPGRVTTSTFCVGLVPCELVAHPGHDDAYLRSVPGLYPDILCPAPDGVVEPIAGGWRAVWIDVVAAAAVPSGGVVVEVSCRHERTREPLFDGTVVVTVIPAELPPLDIVNTHWFHADGLAEYYDVDVYSEEHWATIEAFVRSAGRMGVNSLLVPVWTPPVDTAVGSRRRDVQLVEVSHGPDGYEFDFAAVGRWLDMCARHDIRCVEIPHFFTQWGARSAAPFVAVIDGERREIFGWDTSAQAPEYREFLERFVPALRCYLEARWDPAAIFYHVSDEPTASDVDAYARARAVVMDLLDGCTVIDALSSVELFEAGLVDTPVIATDRVEPFVAQGITRPWVYFCVTQHSGVANRFIGMRSALLRLFGHQLFAADAGGFLHWGFNFYYSALGTRFVDPFRDASGGGTLLAGDPFIVYPGEHGVPWESIRHRIFAQAMYDHRACQFVRDRLGRARTVAMLGVDDVAPFGTIGQPAERVRVGRARIDAAAAATLRP